MKDVTFECTWFNEFQIQEIFYLIDSIINGKFESGVFSPLNNTQEFFVKPLENTAFHFFFSFGKFIKINGEAPN
jgi:hypothetical protein